LSHLGLLALYFVGPLVIRLTAGKDNVYVRHHSTEALNAQITFAIVWNLCGIGGVLLAAINDAFLFLLLGAGIGFIWILTTSILGAVRAWRGVWWRYPGSLRLVRGAVEKGRPPLARTSFPQSA
jgi:uncharacterized Tic20 family protein